MPHSLDVSKVLSGYIRFLWDQFELANKKLPEELVERITLNYTDVRIRDIYENRVIKGLDSEFVLPSGLKKHRTKVGYYECPDTKRGL